MAVFGYKRVNALGQDVDDVRYMRKIFFGDVEYWFADEFIYDNVPVDNRPGFSQLLRKIGDGDSLIVTKLDRLGRNAHEVSAAIKMLDRRNIGVIVVQLGWIDLNGASGELMLKMLVAVAELEHSSLAESSRNAFR